MNFVQAIKQSGFYHLCAAIGTWGGVQWKKSWIVERLTTQKSGRERAEASIFSRAARGLHRGWSGLFERLRLTGLLRGSLFCRPAVWCVLAVVLTPFMPTMGSLALVLVSMEIGRASCRERVS